MNNESIIKYLQAYLDINEIEPIEPYIVIGEIIESKKYKYVHTHHVQWYIFHYFNELLYDRITLEEFIWLWDIYWNIDIYEYKQLHPAFLKSLEHVLENTKKDPESNRDRLIIVDQVSYDYFDEFHSMEELIKNLAMVNAKIVAL